jgi:dihydrofolate reductase
MDNLKPVNIIVAVEETGGFGNKGTIPWRDEAFARDDFKHFQKITKGSVCVMGRKTYEEILEMMLKKKTKEEIEFILPGRVCYVISRNPNLEVVGATVIPNLRKAMETHKEDDKELFVIGGERLFTEALPWTKTIYLTVVKNTYGCDRFFNLKYLDHFFAIADGTKTDNLYFLTYKRTK